jgi:hypothetical protein
MFDANSQLFNRDLRNVWPASTAFAVDFLFSDSLLVKESSCDGPMAFRANFCICRCDKKLYVGMSDKRFCGSRSRDESQPHRNERQKYVLIRVFPTELEFATIVA